MIPCVASAVDIDWVTIGDPGNACDPQPIPPDGCFGSVDYTYRMAKYEVTNAQYVEFLNAVAASDPNGLYQPGMTSGDRGLPGTIVRSGSDGSFTYTAIPDRQNKPVGFVTFPSAMRFANWIHNGQPTGAQHATTTEDGAYTITTEGIAQNTITRNPGANFFIPTEDEWFKAAYYDAVSTTYFDYATGFDDPVVCTTPGSTPNTANCGVTLSDLFYGRRDLADVGSYTGSASPSGTFDQVGNMGEWNETILLSRFRVQRGASWGWGAELHRADSRFAAEALRVDARLGLRLASVPEPGTSSLLLLGLLGLAARSWRKGS